VKTENMLTNESDLIFIGLGNLVIIYFDNTAGHLSKNIVDDLLFVSLLFLIIYMYYVVLRKLPNIDLELLLKYK